MRGQELRSICLLEQHTPVVMINVLLRLRLRLRGDVPGVSVGGDSSDIRSCYAITLLHPR